MFKDVFNLSSILGIAGLIAIFGGAAGYFKAARGKSIIEYQTIENDALRRTLADHEKTIARLNEAGNQKDQTISKLEQHNSYLQKLGQGSPQLKKLTQAIENNTRLIEVLIKGKK